MIQPADPDRQRTSADVTIDADLPIDDSPVIPPRDPDRDRALGLDPGSEIATLLDVTSEDAEADWIDRMAAEMNGHRAAADEFRTAVGSTLLDEVEAYIARYVVYPSQHTRVAHALWIVHTWLMDTWYSTPRIAFLSPEPASGKSRALEVSEHLVPRPVLAVNVSPSYLFRKVSDAAGPPTILFDEIDTVFGPKAKDNEDIRGLLNAGHRRGAVAGRSVVRGKSVETEELPAYCAVAMAGLDDLPETLMSRSIVVRMRKRDDRREPIEAWRDRDCAPEAQRLGQRIAAWAASVAPMVGDPWPSMPPGVTDRPADVWEPLLMIADLAGGDWPRRARVAAVALVAQAASRPPSLGVQLLRDLRSIFDSEGAQHVSTERILTLLNDMDESPWGDIRGRPLDPRGLARRLRRYDVAPKDVRVEGRVVKGYDAADLHDPWSRYVPEAANVAATSATSATGATDAPDVAGVADVAHPAPGYWHDGVDVEDDR